jgi:hypothetical protein
MSNIFHSLFLKFLKITALVIIFLFLFDNRASANCRASDVDVSNCDPEVFDCNNNLMSQIGDGGDTFCQIVAPGSCYEVFTIPADNTYTVCYAKIGQPSPTPAKCGTLNYVCCPQPDLCEDGLIPDNAGDINNCFCVVTAIPTNPPPTSTNKLDPYCGGEEIGVTDPNNPMIKTAIGCIPIDTKGFIGWLLPKTFYLIGGVSFLLIVYGFIIIATSSGDPKKVQAAKETITSALIGLFISVFSLLIINLIIVNILHFPNVQ